MDLSRRGLMGGGIALAAAGGAGTAIVRLGGPSVDSLALTGPERRIVAAVGAVLFPATHFSLRGDAPEVVDEVDRLLAELLEPLHASGFRYVLRALEWGTLASRGTRFSKLDEQERLDVLCTWKGPERMARRVAVDSIKVVFSMAYFSRPSVMADIGWRASCGARES